ncbi:MAG: carboxypeptidase regulatory-like domain-containing protein [Hyphomicrobiales bacterium]|nr:carboxypeptidase regulatory-like domain-containing protein [Hyphomicrobiales bacterium]
MDLLRALLFNRATLSLAALAVAVGLWNVYVAAHDDGLLAGRVVGPDGRPVAGAKVTLLQQILVGYERIESTTTDGRGAFRFTRHNQHKPVLLAEKDGVGASARTPVRLYFRNQNRVLAQPLRLDRN